MIKIWNYTIQYKQTYQTCNKIQYHILQIPTAYNISHLDIKSLINKYIAKNTDNKVNTNVNTGKFNIKYSSNFTPPNEPNTIINPICITIEEYRA